MKIASLINVVISIIGILVSSCAEDFMALCGWLCSTCGWLMNWLVELDKMLYEDTETEITNNKK